MYRVLYRKWRPNSFDEVVGQEHVTETLTNEIQSNRIAHAYLFTGVRGTGKTTCAKILAKAVNCLNPINGNPCGECEACKSIDEESTMDVVEIDAAGNNGVENIRNIIDEITFTPVNLKKRVYIIDEVHMLSIGAFNAFLKTLEEPSEYVVFILATTEINKIPATILSRCQRFDFYRIPIAKMSERLLYISGQEGINLDEKAANLISKLANGALRDALSILERCIMNAQQEDNTPHVTLEVVTDTVGIVGRQSLVHLAELIIKRDTEGVLNQLDLFYKQSKSINELLAELLEYFRDIMVLKSVKSTKDILELSEQELSELKDISQNISLSDILAMMEIIENACTKAKKNIDSRAIAEITLIKLCNLNNSKNNSENSEDMEELLYRIHRLENEVKELRKNRVTSPPPTNRQAPKISDPTKSTIDTEKLTAEAKPLSKWKMIVNILQKSSPSIASAFLDSRAYTNGQYLLIEPKNDLAFTLLRKSANRDELKKIIKEVTGEAYKLGPYRQPKNTVKEKEDKLEELVDTIQSTDIPLEIQD